MTAESSLAVYVDESVHDRLGFIITAFVCASNDLSSPVADELRAVGLVPGRDEFKSSALMATDPRLRDLRDRLLGIAGTKARNGALVSAAEHRSSLGSEALRAFRQLIEKNGCPVGQVHVYMDKGMFASSTKAAAHLSMVPFPDNLTFHLEQDSKAVLGLQVADALAHALSQILREGVSDLAKTVVIGAEGGYEPPIEPPLGWELKTRLRYSLFHSSVDFRERDPADALDTDLLGWGVFVTDDLNSEIRSAVEKAFGKLWLGCVH